MKADRILRVLVVLGVLANSIKCIVMFAGGIMWPYWSLTYRHGFVRRALIGTLFQGITGDLSVDEQQRVVLATHWVLVVALIGAVLGFTHLVAAGATTRARWLLAVGVGAFGLSHFFTTLGDTPGYLDIYVIVVSFAGVFLYHRGNIVASALLGAVGPLIHDEAFFLWLPLLVCIAADVLNADDRRQALRERAILLLPNVVAISALVLHSHTRLMAALGDMPPEWRHIRLFEMPLREALLRMADNYGGHGSDMFLVIAYYAPPFAVTMACAVLAAPWRRSCALLFALLTMVAPCTILIVAWDVSRYFVWMGYGSLLALYWAVRAAKAAPEEAAPLAPQSAWALRAALVVLVLLAVGGPNVYSYFGITFPSYKFGGDWQRHTPAARVTYAWLRFYNRTANKDHYSLADSCPEGGRNIALEDHCAITMKPEAYVESRQWGFPTGRYRAHLQVEPLQTCLDGGGVLAFHERWRLAPMPPIIVPFDAEKTRDVTLDFTVDDEGAAMGNAHVDVETRGGCFRILALDVTKL